MRIVGILALSLLTLGVVWQKGLQVAWDPVTTDINGNPETVVSAEVGLFVPGNDTPINSLVNVNPSGTGQVIDDLLMGAPDGLYQVRVCVYDAAGNKSDWSNAVELIVDRTPPATPTGCRIFH